MRRLYPAKGVSSASPVSDTKGDTEGCCGGRRAYRIVVSAAYCVVSIGRPALALRAREPRDTPHPTPGGRPGQHLQRTGDPRCRSCQEPSRITTTAEMPA